LQEAIQNDSLRLHELEEVGARLKRKSMRLDEEIDKIKRGDAQMGHVSTRGKEPDLDDPPTILAQAVTLLSWL